MTASLAKVALVPATSALRSIDSDITVGKDVLELITGAMYADPLAIYREYLQNAADAIDEARANGLYSPGAPAPKVSIAFDRPGRTVVITDNGVGVPASDFVRRLTAIGASLKRGSGFRGFRGVGRLSGLGYCQELIFRSRAPDERQVSEIRWDGRKLKELLRDKKFDGGLVEAIRTVASTGSSPGGNFPPHFFQVELRKLTRVKADILLNEELVRAYIAQVGPVPFDPAFSLGGSIGEFLSRHNTSSTIAVELNDGHGQIYRPYRNTFQVTEKQRDRLENPEFFEITGLDETTAAVGWILHHSYFGALPRRAGIGGIRARLGNIQIGGSDVFAGLFPEARFNQWCVGEVHILSEKLTPNGRRDEFEYSAHYENFLGQLSPRLAALMRLCRDRSDLRQKLKTANQYVQKAHQALANLRGRSASPLVRKVAEWQCLEALERLERTTRAKSLSESERSLILSEHTRLKETLQRQAARAGRDPFRALSKGKRKDVEGLVRLIFERVRNQRKAEDLARRILHAFR